MTWEAIHAGTLEKCEDAYCEKREGNMNLAPIPQRNQPALTSFRTVNELAQWERWMLEGNGEKGTSLAYPFSCLLGHTGIQGRWRIDSPYLGRPYSEIR